MSTQDFSNTIKNIFSKGAKASKAAFEKAGDKVQDFSDKSVLRIEKKQLESKLEDKYAELGKKVEPALADLSAVAITSEEDKTAVSSLLAEISQLKSQIAEKESLLKEKSE